MTGGYEVMIAVLGGSGIGGGSSGDGGGAVVVGWLVGCGNRTGRLSKRDVVR